MAQKKKKKQQPAQQKSRSPRDTVHPKLAKSLDEAYKLIENKDYEEALHLLLQLDKSYPRQFYVMNMLVVASQELGDNNRIMYGCENMIKIAPNDPNYWIILVGAYMAGFYPLLAIQTIQQFIKRFPHHEEVTRMQDTMEQLEQQFSEAFEETDLPYEEARDMARISEQIQVHFNHGLYTSARREAETLVRRWPSNVRGLNNLSLAYFGEHNLARAIETAKRVLKEEPDNCHALSNLIHYYCVAGDLDAAYAATEQLKQVEVTNLDIAIKKSEGLSYLGDDHDVLDTFYQARDADMLDNTRYPNIALLYHFAAVAALRLDPVENEDEARDYWDEALEIEPDLDVVNKNLDEFDSTLYENHAPWAFEFSNWMTPKMKEELVRLIESTPELTELKKIGIAQRMHRKYPKMHNLVPLWLDRGDVGARDMALALAQAIRSPEMIHALRDFALGQRGPLQMRLEAARIALDAGAIEPGMIRVWSQGEWRDIMFLDFDVTTKPTDTPFSPEVQQLVMEAHEAMQDADFETALALYEEAYEQVPDAPSIRYNMYVVYHELGQDDEAESLIQDIFAAHPDYLFARVDIARKHIQDGAFDEARALLDPLLQRKTFHLSEFRTLCMGFIELFEALEQYEDALSWINMWERVEPEQPILPELKAKIDRLMNPIDFATIGDDMYATTPDIANAPNILSWLRKQLPKG